MILKSEIVNSCSLTQIHAFKEAQLRECNELLIWYGHSYQNLIAKLHELLYLSWPVTGNSNCCPCCPTHTDFSD